MSYKISDQYLNNGLDKEMRVLNSLNLNYIEKIKKKYNLNFNGIDVLDVGIGGGYLAKEFLKRYKNVKYSGVDIAYHLSGDIKQKIELIKADLNHLPDVKRLLKSKTKFDLIFVFDVLEHLIYFGYILQNIHKILSKRGCLIISLPIDVNLSTRLKLLFKDNTFSDPFSSIYGHINLLSIKRLEKGLKNLEELRVVDSQKCGLGYGLYDRKFHLDIIAKVFPSLSSRIYLCLKKR